MKCRNCGCPLPYKYGDDDNMFCDRICRLIFKEQEEKMTIVLKNVELLHKIKNPIKDRK